MLEFAVVAEKASFPIGDLIHSVAVEVVPTAALALLLIPSFCFAAKIKGTGNEPYEVS